MLIESLPSLYQLRKDGRFLGYSLEIGENYGDVVRFKNNNYVILDELGPKGLNYYVHRFYGKIGAIANGFGETFGNIL